MTQSATTKTAVVTGATRGLGLHATEAIAATGGWTLVLAVRDLDGGREVAARTAGAVVELDLADLASVRAAAARLAAAHAPIDALVLNAGLQVTRADRATADGFELTFGVNHLGHFLLTRLLLDAGALSSGARIVVVASGTHFGTFRKAGGYPAPRWRDPRDLARPDGGSGQVAYSTSKLANVLFALEAARRLPELTVDVFDPGLMPDTGLARDYPPAARAVYRRLVPLLRLLPFVERPQEAGRRLARVATDPALAGATGRYFEGERVIEPSPAARDPRRAAELWEASDELVGLARANGRTPAGAAVPGR
jgi:protochlorophyllide reductase